MKQKIYMGFDSREQVAYDVAEHSILLRTQNAEIIPLKLSELSMLKRKIEMRNGIMYDTISDAPMSTEFAISRFCVPFIEKENQWVLFADCDIICTTDIQELFDLADDRYALMVVKHKAEPSLLTKMDGQIQTYYNRKNWSSICLWNLHHPSHKIFDLQMLNEYAGRDLHAFCWLSDEEIGELPKEWNHLVNVEPHIANPKILHYTLGTPNLLTHEYTPYADKWFNEEKKLLIET